MNFQLEIIGSGWNKNISKKTKNSIKNSRNKQLLSPESKIELIFSILHEDNEKIIRKMTAKPFARENEFE